MTTMQRFDFTDADRKSARAELLAMLSPGDTVNVIQRHVSRSGMMRHLSLYVGDENITWLAARAMGEPLFDRYGQWVLKVNGCGMDMHFATVYNLSRALWPDGHPCTGHNYVPNTSGNPCPSNDHSNGLRDFDPSIVHSDGGYALKHRSL